jgi:hypothetical protein
VKTHFAKKNGSTQSVFKKRIFQKSGTVLTASNNAKRPEASFLVATSSILKTLLLDFIQQFEVI